jgi:hypothetical protein
MSSRTIKMLVAVAALGMFTLAAAPAQAAHLKHKALAAHSHVKAKTLSALHGKHAVKHSRHHKVSAATAHKHKTAALDKARLARHTM